VFQTCERRLSDGCAVVQITWAEPVRPTPMPPAVVASTRLSAASGSAAFDAVGTVFAQVHHHIITEEPNGSVIAVVRCPSRPLTGQAPGLTTTN
jgi:hypothetical protein